MKRAWLPVWALLLSNLVINPGFETVVVGWTYETVLVPPESTEINPDPFVDGKTLRFDASAEVPTVAFDGDYVAEIKTRSADNDPVQMYSGRVTSSVFPVSPGKEYQVGFNLHVQSDNTPIGHDHIIDIQIDPGSGTFGSVFPLPLLSTKHFLLKQGWVHFENLIPVFTATGSEARIRFSTGFFRNLLDGQTYDSTTWVDSVEVMEAGVSIRLSERVVDAVEAILQSALGAELAAIDIDRADGVVLAVPAAAQYYKYPRAEVAGQTVHVEIFEAGWTFSEPYEDAQAQRATFQVSVAARITCFNRDFDNNDTMIKRMRRYQVGLFNVINKNYLLTGTDGNIQGAVVRTASPAWELDDEDDPRITVVRAAVTIEVDAEEFQS